LRLVIVVVVVVVTVVVEIVLEVVVDVADVVDVVNLIVLRPDEVVEDAQVRILIAHTDTPRTARPAEGGCIKSQL
jgi:hypothetical protein